MARKHHHPRVHYGTAHETACGLKSPRFGAGVTSAQAKVTCQACTAILATAATAARSDAHAAAQYRIAIREYRRAMGGGLLRPARRLGDLEGRQPVPVRLQ